MEKSHGKNLPQMVFYASPAENVDKSEDEVGVHEGSSPVKTV